MVPIALISYQLVGSEDPRSAFTWLARSCVLSPLLKTLKFTVQVVTSVVTHVMSLDYLLFYLTSLILLDY